MNEADEVNEEQEAIYRPLTNALTTYQFLKYDGKRKKNTSLFLYLSSLTADLLMFDCGCNFTWTSPAMSTLRSTNMDINPLGSPITTVQESWVAALANLGATIGPSLFGKYADVFGRKKMLTMIAILKIISYFILSFSRNIYLFYTARFLLGVGMGLTFAVMPMYTGEIADDHNRGKFCAFLAVFVAMGMLYTVTIGPLLSLKVFTLICTIFLMIPLAGFMLFIPESPVYLVSVGDKSRARKTIMKLKRIDSESSEDYLGQLTKVAEEKRSDKSKFLDIFKTSGLRKAVIIGISLCCLQELSGMFPIMAFIGPIFQITGSKISPYFSSILISIIQLASNIFSSFLIDKVGRRPLLLLSTTGTSVSLFSLGMYFYLKESHSPYTQTIFWLPVTSLVVYFISFSIGLSSVPMAILSEIFPSNVRSVATSFVAIFASFVGFTVTFIFPIIMTFLGSAKCFWLFSGFTALGAIFIYFVIPETKGRSIIQIQNILDKRSRKQTRVF